MGKELTRYAESEYLNSVAMRDALLEYFEVGHLIEINADVLINRIGGRVYGEKVWAAIIKRMKSENEAHKQREERQLS